MANEKTKSTEKYQARSRMLEKLIETVYEKEEKEIENKHESDKL